MLDEAEFDRDDAAPIDMLENYFSAHGWSFEREDDEIVAKVKGSWTEYELRAIWREDDGVLQFLAFPRHPRSRRAPHRALRDDRAGQRAALDRPFRALVGERHPAVPPCRADRRRRGDADAAPAELLVESAIDECERFYPVFQFVLWGGKSPAEAIAAALIETQGEA